MMKTVQDDVNEVKRTLQEQIKVMKDISRKLPQDVEGRVSLFSKEEDFTSPKVRQPGNI